MRRQDVEETHTSEDFDVDEAMEKQFDCVNDIIDRAEQLGKTIRVESQAIQRAAGTLERKYLDKHIDMRESARKLENTFKRIEQNIQDETGAILGRIEALRFDADAQFDMDHKLAKLETQRQQQQQQQQPQQQQQQQQQQQPPEGDTERWTRAAKDAAEAERRGRSANVDPGNTHAAYRQYINAMWANKKEPPTFRMPHGIGILPTPDDRIESTHPLATIVNHDPNWLGQWGHGACEDTALTEWNYYREHVLREYPDLTLSQIREILGVVLKGVAANPFCERRILTCPVSPLAQPIGVVVHDCCQGMHLLDPVIRGRKYSNPMGHPERRWLLLVCPQLIHVLPVCCMCVT